MVGIPKAKRGGGPKTEAGKLASSSNALKTGAYSSELTLPGESEADFKHLEEQVVRDFSPEGYGRAHPGTRPCSHYLEKT